MTRDDIRKLIGGYATGTLTESERRVLFEAAMEDQDLFDELAREQVLKETLEQPGARQRLIASLGNPPRRKWWRKPLAWSAIGGVAVATLALAFLLRPKPVVQTMARLETVQPSALTAPQAPAPAKPVEVPKENRPLAKDARDAKSADRESDKAAMLDKLAAPASAREAEKKDEPAAAQPKALARQGAPFADAPQSNRIALAPGLRGALVPVRFGFDYSLEDQELVIKFAADGFFSIHFSPGLDTIVGSPVKAGSTRREHIPNNATEASIVFTALPQHNSGGVALTREDKNGTVEDPSKERIDLLLRFYP